MSAKEAKANAKGAKAQAKAMRPWYKKKRFILGGIIVLLIAIAVAGGGGGDDTSEVASNAGGSESSTNAGNDSGSDNAEGDASDEGDSEEPDDAAPAVACKDANPDDQVDTKRQGLFPDRPDVQAEDHEAEVGDCVRLAGYTAYVESAAVEPQEFTEDQIVVAVRVQNRDDSAQAYNLFDWSLLTPSGTVIDPTIYLGDGALNSGDLVTGGEATGRVAFDVADPGTYYVIYKPDPFNSVRGVWKIDL